MLSRRSRSSQAARIKGRFIVLVAAAELRHRNRLISGSAGLFHYSSVVRVQ